MKINRFQAMYFPGGMPEAPGPGAARGPPGPRPKHTAPQGGGAPPPPPAPHASVPSNGQGVAAVPDAALPPGMEGEDLDLSALDKVGVSRKCVGFSTNWEIVYTESRAAFGRDEKHIGGETVSLLG